MVETDGNELALDQRVKRVLTAYGVEPDEYMVSALMRAMCGWSEGIPDSEVVFVAS